jgi:hypothetical protein
MSRRWLGLLLVVGLSAGVVQAEVMLPAQERGGMKAKLLVQVQQRSSTPGLAEVVYTLTVEGEVGMEVEPAQVADAVAAWQVEATRSCLLEEGPPLLVKEVLDLRQVKPGQQALPALKVRFRSWPGSPWEEAEWTDLLKPRDVLPPEIAPVPASLTPAWLWPSILAGSGMVLVLIAFASVRLLSRPKPPPPPTPEQWALAELARLEEQGSQQGSEWYHTRLSDIVRRFLEEKYGLKAPRQTTPEFLSSAREATQLSDQQRELLQKLLERCDLAKFAPVQVSPEDCRQTTDLARTLVGGEANAAMAARSVSPPSQKGMGP